MLAGAPVEGEPAIASELHDTYSIGLDAIGDRITGGDLPSACRLAERLLALMALELMWMSAL